MLSHDPGTLRALILAIAVTGTTLGSCAVQGHAAAPKPLKPYAYALPKEAKSKERCEAQAGRIFVKAGSASECIAYFVTKGNEQKKNAVVFLDGDVSLEKYQDAGALASGRQAKHRFMQMWANRTGQRIVDISRVGVNGSSGNHGARRMPHETVIINEALDLLKAKLGLETVTLAGQSGGSTIAAGLLTFGRKDVTCAVLGSGAYEVVDLDYKFKLSRGFKVTRAQIAKITYDPASHVDGIAENKKRRIFVLGDEADSKTPYDQQLRFTNSIRAAGHHARILPIDAKGETDHDAAVLTIPSAGACARGDSDEKINASIPMPKARVAYGN